MTWREIIQAEMDRQGDTWSDVVSATLSDAELDADFSTDTDGIEFLDWTWWTRSRVYFPVDYDSDCKYAASVARNPDGKPTRQIGGG